MVARNYSSTAAETQLSEACTGSATVLRVASIVGFPPVPFTLIVDADTVYEEIVTVTAIAGTNLTVVRGEDGTTGLPHEVGGRVRHGYTARDARDAANHINATANVHGVGASSSVVGTNTTQTLKNKTLDASNSINTGALPTEISTSRLRLTSGSDASESSTAHAFQVGDSAGPNIIIDTNEIIGRSAGTGVGISMPYGINALPTPVGSNEAATKGYVDDKDAARKTYVDGRTETLTSSLGIGGVGGFTVSDLGVAAGGSGFGPVRFVRYTCRRIGGNVNMNSSDFQFGNITAAEFIPDVAVQGVAKIWVTGGTISGTAELRSDGTVWMVDTNSTDDEFVMGNASGGNTSIQADFWFFK